jgi:hypothetical protein
MNRAEFRVNFFLFSYEQNGREINVNGGAPYRKRKNAPVTDHVIVIHSRDVEPTNFHGKGTNLSAQITK